MNLEMLRKRHQDTLDEMRKLVDDYSTREEDFSDEDQSRFDELEKSAGEDRLAIDRIVDRTAKIVAAHTAVDKGGDDFQTSTRNDPYDLSTLRFDTSAHDLRSRAFTAIENDPHLDDAHKEEAIRKLRTVDVRGELATLVLMTGNEAYRSAFPKMVTGNAWAMSDDERNAVLRAQSVGTDTAGGFAVPFTLDPSIILTNAGSINPMRQIASIKTTTTEDWNGVTSAGATANWRAEAAEASDDAITLAQPNIPVHKMDLFVPYSIEIEMDWPQMESELRVVMVDAKDNLEATAHFTGTGTNQPTGIITALDGGSSEVAPATVETFAQADVFNLRRQLPARHRMSRDQPSWVANIGTYDDIRQFDTGGGGGFWTDMTDGTPDRLTGFKTYESSAMDDAQDINVAATADNFILLVGDFKKFAIVDRIGMRVENIPHLFATGNNRPSGQRGLYAVLRTGSDSLDDGAFRLLNVATTA